MRRKYPNPILDAKEQNLITDLQREFEDFTKPGVVKRTLTRVQDSVAELIPTQLKTHFAKASQATLELEWLKQAIEYAESGFQTLQEQAARLTVSKDTIVAQLSERGTTISEFNEVCLLRSYDIEAIIESKTYQDYLLAFVEGVATGAPGFFGIPFNLVLSFFLFFRATQNIALHYGFDVKDDPRELQIAAEVTTQSLDPNFKAAGLEGIIGKMMTAANVTTLKQSLATRTYAEMAQRGGSELLYVKIRALASKAAAKALEKTGEEGIEAGIFKTLLEQLGKQMPKKAGKASIPIISALIVGFTDTALMRRVLRGAKLIYHKRYLLEKEHRIAVLKKTRQRSRGRIARSKQPRQRHPHPTVR